MPKKPPPTHTRFKPGQSGNPGGKVKVPDDIKEARKLNQHELERIVNKYLYMDRDAVKAAISAPGTPMMELMVASIVAQAAQKGDHQRLDFVLNRLIGKVKDQLDVTVAKPFVVRHTDGSQTVLGSELEKKDDG
jgi:hypothetical protein